jgi:uncharacterized membrane protein
MANKIQEQLRELLEHNIITEEVALSISNYYKKNDDSGTSKLFLTFGVIGAILASLGIILVFAHNWDTMSRFSKCVVSFLPLIVGQFFCGFSLFCKNNSAAWKESSASFLFFAVGATISLIAQTYNISGDFDEFMLTWMLLCLPIIYLMSSNLVSLLYIAGITVYCINTNYWRYDSVFDYTYWLLLLGVVPHYWSLLKGDIISFRALHHWFIALTLTICWGSFGSHSSNDDLLYFGYSFLFTAFYFVAKTAYFSNEKLLANGFAIVGKLGIMYMLYMGSFKFLWRELMNSYFDYTSLLTYSTLALFILSLLLLFRFLKRKTIPVNEIIQYAPLFFGLCYLASKGNELFPVIICNAYLLLLGIREIGKVNETDSIPRLNFGVLIIAILITCRFFDTEMSFIARGILFILVGASFFGLNYYMLKKRKQNEK